MGTKLSPKDEELYRRTGEVLHYLWDPIGVSGVPEARDEYDSYLPGVFSLVKQGERAETIAKHLLALSVDQMGLQGDYKRDLEIAGILLDWKEAIAARPT